MLLTLIAYEFHNDISEVYMVCFSNGIPGDISGWSC